VQQIDVEEPEELAIGHGYGAAKKRQEPNNADGEVNGAKEQRDHLNRRSLAHHVTPEKLAGASLLRFQAP
jgi:hypothetical protein